MSVEFRREMERLQVGQELEVIFGSSGSEALLREFSSRYSVTVVDAVKRPTVFQQALFFLLGDLGANLVMKRINQRISSLQVPLINAQ
jgi:hypothetical protein